MSHFRRAARAKNDARDFDNDADLKKSIDALHDPVSDGVNVDGMLTR